jgi:hypothetical protein
MVSTCDFSFIAYFWWDVVDRSTGCRGDKMWSFVFSFKIMLVLQKSVISPFGRCMAIGDYLLNPVLVEVLRHISLPVPLVFLKFKALLAL